MPPSDRPRIVGKHDAWVELTRITWIRQSACVSGNIQGFLMFNAIVLSLSHTPALSQLASVE